MIERMIFVQLIAPYIYANENKRIELYFSSAAMEADASDDGMNDEASKQKRSTDFIEKVKAVIALLKNILEKIIVKLKNGFKSLWETSHGFEMELRKAEAGTRPKDAINVITFQYVDQILETSLSKLENAVNKILESIISQSNDDTSDPENPLNMDNDKLIGYVLKNSGFSSEVVDEPSLFHYLRQSFRGNKTQKIIKKASIEYYTNVVRGTKKFTTILTGKLNDLSNKTNSIESKLRVASGSANISDDSKRKMISQMKNISVLYNLYSTVVHSIFELRTEEVMAARIILKKFYYLST